MLISKRHGSGKRLAVFSLTFESRLKKEGRTCLAMAEDAGGRGIFFPLLLLFLAHSLGAPIWLLVMIGIWYSGLVYAESNGILDRLDATRAMGIILMIRTRRGMRLLDFVSKPKRFWRGFGELSIGSASLLCSCWFYYCSLAL